MCAHGDAARALQFHGAFAFIVAPPCDQHRYKIMHNPSM